ncbi:myb DNA-binding domain protein [Medicago truncatula]|uniref:Myb DNA-binding domain protein n=1 Tax=Medicago truncatula TaxID=3880 RepID=A0A072VME4_MEDTR|nr:myb DNA-binding domain protein [Medicago truncatula]
MPSSSDTNKRLKKGTLWSKEEDEILKAYVEKHGTGNWKEVSKNTGLAHCGNSCRFRWYNTLRPDLRKGPFSKEEEEKFFELFSKFGEFKWSKMALEMPGRTDNDIKNFWNARKRKHQRHCLSPFPDNNMELVDGLNSSNGKRIRNSQENKFKIPEVIKFGNQILHTNLFDDSNMFFNNVGSTSTCNHTTSTLIDRDGVGTSTISIPNMGYPQNPQPMETQYQLSQSISPYKSGSLESMLYTQENWESLDTIRMHFETNLVDEKGKKQISSESDVEVNHDDIMNPELWDDMWKKYFNKQLKGIIFGKC